MSRPRKPLALRPAVDAKPPTTAMVMAAGLGMRMRPLTATRPKPLVVVAGKTLLDHTLDRLRAGGVTRAVVNVHYLADALEAYLAAKASDLDIAISDERDLLMETGGGLVKAEPLLRDDPFLCVNSDNLWVDGPVDATRLLAARWDEEAMDALLLVVPLARANCHKGQGDFHVRADGRVTSRRKPGHVAPFVFTGVQMLSHRLLRDPPSRDRPFSTMWLWERAMAEGRLYAVVHQGLWFDVGTPQAIPHVEAALSGG